MKFIRIIAKNLSEKDLKNILNSDYIYYDDALEYVKFCIENNKQIPNFVLNEIIKNSYDCFKYVKLCIENNKQIPDKILKRVSSFDMLKIAKLCIENNKQIPDFVLNEIIKDSYDCFEYAKLCIENNKQIPDFVLNEVSKNSVLSYKFAEFLEFKNVPEIILNSAKSKINFEKSKKYNKIKKFLNIFVEFLRNRYANFNCNDEFEHILKYTDYELSNNELIYDNLIDCLPATMSGRGKGAEYNVHIKINIENEEVDFKISGEIVKWTSGIDKETLKEISEQKTFTIDQFLKAKRK